MSAPLNIGALGAALATTLLLIGAAPALGDEGGRDLRLWGEVRALYPGEARVLRVRVRNPFGHPVALRHVSARPRRGAKGCGPDQLVVATRRRRAVVQAHAVGIVPLRVRLRASAPDACQGVTFPLRLKARGRVMPVAETGEGNGGGSGGSVAQLPYTGLCIAGLAGAGLALALAGARLRRRAGST